MPFLFLRETPWYGDPGVEDERAEIEEAVQRELTPLGVRGTVALAGKCIELSAGGAPIAIDIDIVQKQWKLLPPEMQLRKVKDIARGLAEAHRSVHEASRFHQGPDRNLFKIPRPALALLGLLVVAGLVKGLVPRVTRSTAPVGSAAPEDIEQKARLSRACDAMRDRIYQGGSFGAFAMEGWTVELWLSSRKGDLSRSAALSTAIANGKLTAAGEETLAGIRDGTVELSDGFTREAADRSPGWNAVTIVFHEGYARAFFEPESRSRFIDLSERLANSSGAEIGALYGRCAHLSTHDVGAWFHGTDATGAATAMVYQLGLFSDAPVVNRPAMAILRAPGELDALWTAASKVSVASLAPLLATHGGSVTTSHGVTVVFPLGGPTRAIGATRDLARKMNLGLGSD